jgi:hypothetical protein
LCPAPWKYKITPFSFDEAGIHPPFMRPVEFELPDGFNQIFWYFSPKSDGVFCIPPVGL